MTSLHSPTVDEVQRIIEYHRDESTAVISLEEARSQGYSAFTPTRSFIATLDDGTTYTLRISSPAPPAQTYAPNSLQTEQALLQLLSQHTSIPIPAINAFDTSLSLVPYHYLLLARPRGISLSSALASGKLNERQVALLDLRIGAFLKQLHEQVQNDWFGLPTQEADGLYSWQEAFTLLLEELLEEAKTCDVPLPYEDVRRALSRAIGSFLFDDCEVPSLISFTGDAETTLVDFDLEKPDESDEVDITSFLSVSHALWGDPLLETMMMNPSEALLEGYGGSLIVFPRQKTKRLWYTLFLALMVTVQYKRDEETQTVNNESDKVKWAAETIQRCAEELKDAPYY
ncbi:hypothetical protein CERSUDRAFT_155821 [Gelatoporia subvermispora B]|uniref:Aminoglycoside phosphotransferase domain-containing protein n=1 Tax=Ceriporiopsis subvermispora (strain B) TaxID=914234 RepID=M2RBJ6_CERS8|nr:hypothetical protein CERSUDRAFT_155821 [Gelatoporia subvermispora B]